MGDLVCVYVFIFTWLFVFSAVCACLAQRTENLSLFLAKGEPARGQPGESCCYLLSGHTLHKALQCPVSVHDSDVPSGAAHLFERTSCVALISMGGYRLFTLSLLLLGCCKAGFHLRSSCLCCNLITLNFPGGEQHAIS